MGEEVTETQREYYERLLREKDAEILELRLAITMTAWEAVDWLRQNLCRCERESHAATGITWDAAHYLEQHYISQGITRPKVKLEEIDGKKQDTSSRETR